MSARWPTGQASNSSISAPRVPGDRCPRYRPRCNVSSRRTVPSTRSWSVLTATLYEILSNAETWLAAQRAGWHEVPVDVRDDITDEDAEAILALTNGAGRVDPIEEARQLEAQLEQLCAGDRRRRHGAITRLARVVGKSRTHISTPCAC